MLAERADAAARHCSTMKSMTSCRPLPRDRSVKPNGRLPRMRRGVALHHVEIDVHIGREVALVDDQEIGARDAGPALARDLLALADRDDIERQVGEVGREGGGEIVAAGFDEDDVEIGDGAVHLGDRLQVDRGVLADRGVRAAAGLDAHDAVLRQRLQARQHHGVFLGVDVVGDDGDRELVAQRLAELFGQRRLAGADRPADADAKRSVVAISCGELRDAVAAFMSGTAANTGFRASST